MASIIQYQYNDRPRLDCLLLYCCAVKVTLTLKWKENVQNMMKGTDGGQEYLLLESIS
jgi:hypothetical protein